MKNEDGEGWKQTPALGPWEQAGQGRTPPGFLLLPPASSCSPLPPQPSDLQTLLHPGLRGRLPPPPPPSSWPVSQATDGSPGPPQLSGEGSLGTEVISSQAGIVDLQQDAGVVHGGREDLGRWGESRVTGWGWFSPDQGSEMGLPACGPGCGRFLQEDSPPAQPLSLLVCNC